MYRHHNLPKLAALIILTMFVASPLQSAYSSNMQQNHVVLKIQKGAAVDDVLIDLDAAAIDTIAGKNTFLVYYNDPLPVDTVVSMLQADPDVVYAQPNYLCAVPEIGQISQSFPDENRPVYISGVSPILYYDQPGVISISADSANLLSIGAGVTVAVIDNGIDYTHPLFENYISPNGYDFIDEDNIAAEMEGDLLGHGTFVSGIVRRIAPGCMIMPLRAFDGNGIGSSFNVAKALYWAIVNDADVINMSFSMTVPDPAIGDAISDVVIAGISLVASSGNDGQNLTTYPAAFTGVISVSAIDSLEYLADFSNYGNYIDVCAPGVKIYSSLAGEYQWGVWSGTSFSAPIVSGVCALVSSLNPEMSALSMGNLIRSTAETDLLWGSISTNDPMYGWGKVNAFAAVWGLAMGNVDELRGTNILDVSYLGRYIYQNGPPPKPEPMRGDFDLSGNIDSLDLELLVGYLYRGGKSY